MSKEIEIIDTYIEQQTSQISELMQTVILLQTKVKMAELENKKLEAKNARDDTPIRNGVRTNITTSKRKMDPVQAKIVINGGFTTRKGAPEE